MVATNQAARLLFDEGSDTARGSCVLDRIEHDPDLRATLQRACHDGVPFLGEVLWTRHDGKAFWNDLVVVPSSEAGQMLAISRDVTKRRTAEASLDTGDRAGRAILDRIQAGVIVHAASSEILYANAKALEILGVSHDAALLATNDDPRWAFIRADGEPMKLEEFPVAVAVRTRAVARDIIVGHRRPNDGRFVWFVCNAYPVLNDRRGVVEVLVSFTDVTTLMQTEQELMKSQERLQLVLEGSGGAPWDWDLVANELYYSARWFHQLGLDPAAVEGGPGLWESRLVDEDRARVPSEFAAILASSATTYDIEFSMVRGDGRRIRVHSRGFIKRDAAGRALRASGTNTDVTEQRATEAQMRQSQKLNAIGQLAGGVAHDFNNVLAVVVGNLDLIRDELPPNSALGEAVTDSLLAAQRGADLTRRLLAFSRQQVLETAVLDLECVVVGTERLISRLIGETVAVDVRVPSPLPAVRVDVAQFENVLVNLSINARDAMPSGGRLTITLEQVSVSTKVTGASELMPGQYVRVRLTDTGHGMSPETLAKALDPFFTTKPVGVGTGLGLSMAYGFARQSGGALHLESAEGRGTTVSLYLPTTDEPAEKPAGPSRRRGLIKAQARSETVLVVEDDESIRRLCVRALETLGFPALAASCGPEALELLASSGRVDVLLTDVALPRGMDGRALAAHARERQPMLRVLYMSGHRAEPLNSQCLEPRARMLSKPFTIEDLARAIEGVLVRPQ